MDEIRDRLRRLYAAVDDTTERDLSRVPGVVFGTEDASFFVQDFSGDLSPEQRANRAHTAISLAAHLRDPLRGQAKRLGRDPAEVEDVIRSCPALAILIDLANREKHGGTRRGGSWSGRGPELRNITRHLRLAAGPGPGSGVSVQFTPDGPQVHGSGSADVIITGDVVDSDGTRIGDLHAILLEAVQAWEELLRRWLAPRR